MGPAVGLAGRMAPVLPALLALGPATMAGPSLVRRTRSVGPGPLAQSREEFCTARACGPIPGGWPRDEPSSGMGSVLLVAALLLVALSTTGCSRGSSNDDDFEGCEGHWSPAANCVPLGDRHPSGKPDAENKYCPQWRIDPKWKGRDTFLQRLNEIEESVKEADLELGPMSREELEKEGLGNVDWVNVARYKGLSPSRIEAKKFVGSSEFREVDGEPAPSMCWPDGYSWYYVSKFNVVPSRRFQRFVENFDLAAFKAAVWKLTHPEEQAEPDKNDSKAELVSFLQVQSKNQK